MWITKLKARLLVALSMALAGMAAWLRITQLKHKAERLQVKARRAETIVNDSRTVSKRAATRIARIKKQRREDLKRIARIKNRNHFEID